MARRALALLIGLLAATTTGGAPSQLRMNHSITLATARKIAIAAQAEALKNKWQITVTVLDSGANLILAERMDETEISSIETSRKKAYTAVTYKRPTSAFEDALKSGNSAVLTLKNVIPISGGLPIVFDGEVVGGIGVSGSGNPNDLRCAKAGLDAIQTKK